MKICDVLLHHRFYYSPKDAQFYLAGSCERIRSLAVKEISFDYKKQNADLYRYYVFGNDRLRRRGNNGCAAIHF